MNPAAHFTHQLQQFVQQPYPWQPGFANGQMMQDHHPLNQGHPHQQHIPMHLPQHQFPQHRFPQHQFLQYPPLQDNPFTQIPLEDVHPSQVPPPPAPEWPQPFNEAELKVAGIMPYTYGMPRYGQQPFRPEGGDMTNKLNPYGRGFPYGFYKTVL